MKKTIILIVSLLITGGVGIAGSFFSKYENELILARGVDVFLHVNCGDVSGTCFYRCPVCESLYEATTKQGPFISGPSSCGCDNPNPGTGEINPDEP